MCKGRQLVLAMRARRYEEVKQLINEGTPVNYLDENGHSPLYWAVQAHNGEFCALLIEHGAEVNETMLEEAEYFGNIQIYQLLSEHMTKQETDDKETSNTSELDMPITECGDITPDNTKESPLIGDLQYGAGLGVEPDIDMQ